MRGVFSLNTMRKYFVILVLLSALTMFGQNDSISINDILDKLNNLEKLKVKNDSVSSVKAITDAAYANSIGVVNDSIAKDIYGPIIHFDTSEYCLGSITQGVVAKQKFSFTNKGTEDLEIINVVPDCSCTSPEWSDKPIKPGEKRYIIATYDSKEDVGKFIKTITVLHNAGEGWSFLEIRGFVAPKL